MATADTEGHLSGRDCLDILFSKHYCEQLIRNVVKIADVVQKFIDCMTLSEAERQSFRHKKLADDSLRNILTIISNHSNGKDLQPFKKFIDILGDTNNIGIAEQLLPIYQERVYHAATLSLLSKEQSLVKILQNEIISLKKILEEKERYIESLTDEKNKLVDHYRKVAEAQREKFRGEKLSLEKQIKEKEEDLVFAKKEIEKLTRTKNDLENEVTVKSNVIRKIEEEIVEKERKVREAIEESNRLRLEIDLLQQHSKAMTEDKEIEILEDKITEKENAIMDSRKRKTMTRKEVEEELGIITRGHEKKQDDQTAIIKQQKEEKYSITKAHMALIKQQNEKIDDQAAMIKQQNEKFDVLSDAVMRVLKIQEKK